METDHDGTAMHVIAINMVLEAMMLSDGSHIDITDWFDEEGDDCDKSEAVVCVAGPCSLGLWYNAVLNDYSKESLN